jgi:hypothetical protein
MIRTPAEKCSQADRRIDNPDIPEVMPGSVVVVTEGLRPVAFFHVERVDGSD